MGGREKKMVRRNHCRSLSQAIQAHERIYCFYHSWIYIKPTQENEVFFVFLHCPPWENPLRRGGAQPHHALVGVSSHSIATTKYLHWLARNHAIRYSWTIKMEDTLRFQLAFTYYKQGTFPPSPSLTAGFPTRAGSLNDSTTLFFYASRECLR